MLKSPEPSLAENPSLKSALVLANQLFNTWVKNKVSSNVAGQFFSVSPQRLLSDFGKLSIVGSTNPQTDEHYKSLLTTHSGYVVNIYPMMPTPPLLDISLNDFNQRQKNLCKQIKQIIVNSKHFDHHDLYAFILLIKDFYFAVAAEQNNPNIDFRWIKDWTKLAFLLINRIDTLRAEKPKQSDLHYIYERFTYRLALLHMTLANVAINHAKTDFDLSYADSLVESGIQLYEQYSKDKYPIEDLSNLLYSIEATVAIKTNDKNRLVQVLDKLSPTCLYPETYIDIYKAAGDFFKDTDPKVAIECYEEVLGAIYYLKLNNPKLQATLRETCKALRQSFKDRFVERIHKEHPHIKIKNQKEDHKLHLFLPLDKIPRGIKKFLDPLKVFESKILENNVTKSKSFTGLYLSTDCIDEEIFFNSLRRIESFIKRSDLPSREKDNVGKEPVAISEPATDILNQNKILHKKFQGFKESPIEPYIKPSVVEKAKTRGIPSQPTLPADITPRLDVCRANDFGFSLPDNPVVTPVYCSQAGQAARNPTLFVRWVGIPKAEDSVVLQFQDMLNPQLAGILTVGMYNQQGAKLWKNPDGLGDSWHHCALRFKRKGAAGCFRAIAEPECKISVEQHGKAENRYLFKLGTLKHK